MEGSYKFATPSPEDRQFQCPNYWTNEKKSDGENRLVIAPAIAQVELLIRLFEMISEPFRLLYVLVINRGGSELGNVHITPVI